MYEKLTWGKNWKCINKDPNVHIVLLDFRITKIHGDKHTLIKTIHLAKCFPISATKMGYSQNYTDLLQNPYHDGSLGEFSLFQNFYGLQDPSSPRHGILHGMG